MDRFIARANIAHLEDLLAREIDPEKRRVVETLLAREKHKLEIAIHQADTATEQDGPSKIEDPAA
ncbi:hypothetical protein [Mesorhizobium erdmanii]|uniref:Uncharacterized protein n=1 Tax=Mesorhizobium erdmanii TaxID=1777866 RepID=A0A6M7UCR8_9HYPH|nr:MULTISPECIES: hypothetical protein [Mesorhizobium]OBQ57808.1 hypothetical protein A8146_22340 [Mesorhizobium loti]QKC75599.1 hypothetical protein EB233_08655 [Mesorhizobium erdmanii]